MKKSILSKIDKPLLFMVILYSIIGVFMVLSASSVSAVMEYDESPYYFFIRQILFFIFSYFIGFVFILRKSTKKYKKYINFACMLVLVLLVYVLVKGRIVNSARSWIAIGSFGFQPSEIAKTVIIIYFGVFYGELQDKMNSKYSFLIPIIYSIIVFFLIFRQPDLGTALITAAVAFLTFFAIPFKGNQMVKQLKILAGSVAVAAAVLLLSGSFFLNEMQSSRLTYKAPCTRYTENTGYQVCNGFIAFNNGGLFGKGIGNSTQKYLYLPDSHTDMIFPIMVEELGLIAGVLFIAGYAFILYRIVVIAKSASNLRNSIIAYGIGIYLLIHILVNFLGILALIPMTGTPVPFLSYGGSFTINLMLCMFIVLRISGESKMDKTKEAISRI